MTNELAPVQGNGIPARTPAMSDEQALVLERVVVGGNLAELKPAQRIDYYRRVCESVGVNPYTKPFQFIELNRKLTLYATRDCTDQLRDKRGVNITKLERESTEGLYVVTAHASMPNGRTDVSTGAVPTKGLVGDALANAIMKAETKAKRRVTLSICGLGWTDESEVETIADARPVNVDMTTGEVLSPADPKAVRNEAWRLLANTEGFFPDVKDKTACREFVAHLLGRDVPKLADLTAEEFDAARSELEQRGRHKRRYFALEAKTYGSLSDDESRGKLADVLGVPVESRRNLTAAQWQQAADALDRAAPVEPPAVDVFADE